MHTMEAKPCPDTALMLASAAFEAYNCPEKHAYDGAFRVKQGRMHETPKGTKHDSTVVTLMDGAYVQKHISGVLSVTLKNFENLPTLQELEKSGPRIIVSTPHDEKFVDLKDYNTAILSHSLQLAFMLLVRDPTQESLAVRVIVHETSGNAVPLFHGHIPLAPLAAQAGGSGVGPVDMELTMDQLCGTPAAVKTKLHVSVEYTPTTEFLVNAWTQHRLPSELQAFESRNGKGCRDAMAQLGLQDKLQYRPLAFIDTQKYVGAEAWLFYNPAKRFVIVAFRGTEKNSKMDQITDLRATPLRFKLTPSPGGGCELDRSDGVVSNTKAHKGFLSTYSAIRHQVTSLLDELLSPEKEPGAQYTPWTVYVTGHSLGGALATLCAYELAIRTWQCPAKPSLTMYNFGSPRVGTHTFAAEYNRLVPDSWRFVNTRDIVASIPSKITFSHVGHVVTITLGVGMKIWSAGSSPGQGNDEALDAEVTAELERLDRLELGENAPPPQQQPQQQAQQQAQQQQQGMRTSELTGWAKRALRHGAKLVKEGGHIAMEAAASAHKTLQDGQGLSGLKKRLMDGCKEHMEAHYSNTVLETYKWLTLEQSKAGGH